MTAAANRRQPRSLPAELFLLMAVAAALLAPAIINGFPLIFPDTGTYLSIALANDYAGDRSSFYGFFIKILTTPLPGAAGLWATIALQAVIVAAATSAVARSMAPRRVAVVMALTLLFTSVAFHVAQLMPDAFTGIAVLLAWLAARRDISKSGTILLWLALSAVALTHYTHLALIAAAAGSALLGELLLGVTWRRLAWRGIAAAGALMLAALVQIAMNGAVLGQKAVAPMGPMFLYARMNEDGLIKPWLQRHCGRDAPQAICALAPKLPDDSQQLLWAKDSPLRTAVWNSDRTKMGWNVIHAMDVATKGALAQSPGRFAANSVSAGARQFVTFAPLDDECPVTCRTGGGNVEKMLARYRPASLAALDQSMQVTDRTPKQVIRMVMIPVAAIALILLPFAAWAAWRRRDRDTFSLVLAVSAALVANAGLAGALSDIHDRYQSRIVWIAPFAIFLVCARWKLVETAWGRLRDRH